MYPPGAATRITVAGPAEGFEGAVRPGHFEGVATVVTKLLNQTAPDVTLFGEKDWQQVQVVTRLAADLDLPTQIVPIPTIRDADGLALSSRNRHLTPGERALAPRLYAILQATAARLASGQTVIDAERESISALQVSGFETDYLRLADATTLHPLDTLQRPARLLAAARLGAVRLLDNIAL
jgi:pantoate--beta-alanine ligase